MSDEKVFMSKDDVFEVVQLANQLYSQSFLGVYTPFMSNQNLISLNNNPLVPDRKTLDKALKSSPYDAKTLQAFSEFAEVYDKLFARTIDYYAGMLSFDVNWVCRNAYKKEKDYKSQEYKDDLRRVDKFFDCFDYVSEFNKVVRQILRREVYYTWLRDSAGTFEDTGEISADEKVKKLSTYTLQMMPQERCLLTGTWEQGLLYDFDMNYFLKAGVDINSYDPIFKTYWKDVFGAKEPQKYVPTAPLNARDGTFALWTQTSPADGAWAWKLDISNMNTVPFLSSMIKNALTNAEIEELQRDVNFLAARGIIAGMIPMLDKQKSGETQDAMAWNSTTLMKFMQLVKAGLDKNINAVAMPTEDNKFFQYENKNPSMYTTQLENTAGNGASASRLIYSNGKAGQFEIQAQIENDYNFMRRIYSQFENFLNFYVNKKTRKYKFNFIVSGSNYDFIREKEKKNLLDLADRGIVLNARAYAKIAEMKPHDFERSLDEAHYGDFTEKLTMLLSIHTQSGKDGGRPKADSSEVGDSGAYNKDI